MPLTDHIEVSKVCVRACVCIYMCICLRCLFLHEGKNLSYRLFSETVQRATDVNVANSRFHGEEKYENSGPTGRTPYQEWTKLMELDTNPTQYEPKTMLERVNESQKAEGTRVIRVHKNIFP